MKAVRGFFQCCGNVGETLQFHAVDLRYAQRRHFLVADRRGRRQDACQEDDFLRSILEKLGLVAVHIDSAFRCAAKPVRPEIPQHLPREFLQHEAAENVEARRFIHDVRVDHIFRRRLPRKGGIERHRDAFAKDVQLHRIADKMHRAENVPRRNFSILGVGEVAVLIDRKFIHSDQHIAFLHARFCSRAVLRHVVDVNAAGHIGRNFRVASERRIAHRAHRVAGARKAVVLSVRRVLQEMLDDGRWNEVRIIRRVVIRHEHAG